MSNNLPSACAHRSPLNYDHTRWAVCVLPAGHDGDHRQGELGWATGFMPCKVSVASDKEQGPR